MAHWIVHLRIAQELYERSALRSKERFVLGSIAPDSGDPRPDGLGYEPDGSVTHFRDSGDRQYHEERFIARYFTPQQRAGYGADAYAFFLGYLTHLLTDKLWRQEILPHARQQLSGLYFGDRNAFVRLVNEDWAQLDFSYLKAHPGFDAWTTYMQCADMRNVYVEFYDEDAFSRLRARQIPYYRRALEEFATRETYLSEGELTDFIQRASAQIYESCGPYFKELIRKENPS